MLLFTALNELGKVLKITFQPSCYAPDLSLDQKLQEITRQSKIHSVKLTLKGNWWQRDHGTMLGVIAASNQPVALTYLKPNKYRLHNPATGIDIDVTADIASILATHAYAFYERLPAKKNYLKDWLAFALSGCRSDLITIGIVGLLGALVALLPPILTAYIFNSITMPLVVMPKVILWSLIALLFGAVGSTMFQVTRNIALLRINGKVVNTLQGAIWARVLSLPLAFFKKYLVGDLFTRAQGINKILPLLHEKFADVLITGIFSLCYLPLLFYFSATLALIALAVLFIIVMIIIAVGRYKIQFEQQATNVYGKMINLLVEIIDGISKIRVAGNEDIFFQRFIKKFSLLQQKRIAREAVNNILGAINTISMLVLTMVIFSAAAYLFAQQSFPIGDFLAFNMALGCLTTAILGLINGALNVSEVIQLYQQAKPLLAEPSETLHNHEYLVEMPYRASRQGNVIKKLSGAIEINNLSFSYELNNKVLENISCNIKPNSLVGIVGSSGSGKSTLLRLLLRFEQPSAGKIYFDGQDLNELDVELIRNQIGAVLPNDRLLHGNIFSNITAYSPVLTIDDAWAAARIVGLAEDIAAMPMGMFTFIGDNGAGLAGGQRQRVLLARAIVRRPKIILFDEATSALDNISQNLVMQSIKQLNSTRVVVAHRLSTVRDADQIMVLNEGKIVETGTYEQLISSGGLFAKMAERQMV